MSFGLMSRGLDCPFCNKGFSFGSMDSACIRLYACCEECAFNMKIKTNKETITKNKIIWLKMEKHKVFGEGYGE